MKLLITGGMGFIGSHLSELLYKQGHEITIIDNLNIQVHNDKIFHKYYHKFIEENIQDLNQDLEFDIVFHLASETGTGQSMYEIEKYVSTNINGTVRLLEKLKNKPKIILTSSRSVYGEGKYICPNNEKFYPESRLKQKLNKRIFDIRCPYCNQKSDNLPSKENDILNPISIYATTKLTQENLIKNYCYYNGNDYTILRLQNVYGKGQSLHNPYTGILSIFSNQILNDQEINVFEDGEMVRDFIYVSDIANILLECITNKKTNNEVINVGNGTEVKIIDIVKKLIDIYGKGSYRISGDYRVGDIRSNFPDLYKFYDIFQYRNKVNIDSGLKLLSDWVINEQR